MPQVETFLSTLETSTLETSTLETSTLTEIGACAELEEDWVSEGEGVAVQPRIEGEK